MANLGRQLSNPGSGSVPSQRFVLRGPDGAEAEISALRDGFRQGFVLEILDTSIGETIRGGVFVFPLNPTKYTLSEPFQTTLTPAEDNTVVSEENGIIVREVTLEGTFGLREKRARGFQGAQGGGNPLTGTEHFNELRNFFRLYSSRKKDPLRNATTQMIFHALRDDDHFVVVPKSFETPRDSQRTRVHHEYRLTMSATGGAAESGLRPTEDTSGFDFTDALRDINEAFNDARAAFAEVTANLAMVKRKVGNIQAVLGNAAQVLNAVGGFVMGTANLVNYPLQLVATTTEQLATAGEDLITSVENVSYGVLHENARSIARIEAAFDRLMMYPDRFEAVAEQVEDFFAGERNIASDDIARADTSSSPAEGGATVGTRTRVAAGSDGRLAGLDVPRRSGLRAVEVQRTDSVESIATAAGTTPEAVILINDLRPPYITGDGGPGIAKPGDLVLVPGDATEGSATGPGVRDYLTSEEALYGVDLLIDRTLFERTGKFDIAVRAANGAVDCEVTTGIRNVVQGTEITVNTERGTTVFLPDIGIRRNVGTKGTVQHVLLASATLREALLADPRISGIESSRVVLNGDVLEQEITPIVSGQRPGATLVLPFGRASGG